MRCNRQTEHTKLDQISLCFFVFPLPSPQFLWKLQQPKDFIAALSKNLQPKLAIQCVWACKRDLQQWQRCAGSHPDGLEKMLGRDPHPKLLPLQMPSPDRGQVSATASSPLSEAAGGRAALPLQSAQSPVLQLIQWELVPKFTGALSLPSSDQYFVQREAASAGVPEHTRGSPLPVCLVVGCPVLTWKRSSMQTPKFPVCQCSTLD